MIQKLPRLFPLYFIGLFLFSHGILAQEIQWTYSDGGHLTERSWGLELQNLEVIYFNGFGLDKFSESGELLWHFDFFDLDDYQYSNSAGIRYMTADEVGNLYAVLDFPGTIPGVTTLDNIDIPHGYSLIKISTHGNLLWSRKLENTKNVKLAYNAGKVYAVGSFDREINLSDTYFFDNLENTECGTGGWQNEYAEDIFLARFNTIGQLETATTVANPGYDVPKAIAVDASGNLYLAGNYGLSSCLPDETRLYKFNPNLETIWSKTISREYEEGNGGGVLEPANLYIGKNEKLYLWAYSGGTVISGNFRFEDRSLYGQVGGLIEFSSHDASFLRYRAFSGLSINGRNGFMSDYGDHLLIATTFRETQEFDNGSLTTINSGEEPVLIRVDLNNFSFEHFLHLKGRFRNDEVSIEDWSGPIGVREDALYYSGSYSSDTLLLDETRSLVNNSGNNDQDFFLIKYDLSAADFTSTPLDDDGDGVPNRIDHCPDTPPGEAVTAQGCSDTQRDSDLDGVLDVDDLCSETPIGEAADASGCSASQRDEDQDGIPDSEDLCPGTGPGTVVNAEGCRRIVLDPAQFEVLAMGETCFGKDNGSITISTSATAIAYTAMLGPSGELSFTGEGSFKNLVPGSYELCIKATNYDSDTLCYNVQIPEAEKISLNAIAEAGTGKITLELSGSAVYYITHNGKEYTTQDSSFELPLEEGLNSVLVSSDKACAGEAAYLMYNGEGMRLAPNPFSDSMDVLNPHKGEEVTVRIYTQAGQMVYSKAFPSGETLHLDGLERLPAGIYLLECQSPSGRYSQKVLKQ